ncbi:uncharacterized protein LOC120921618 [Rana temporaria]|uniref:uncharacterized protein LOC120921618 n=1 Tax=Rana temporaria TaxID=8407 RepID=UPI001AADCA8F|nr:uncharacterized protein LOC120921618 [Rana temporaria]
MPRILILALLCTGFLIASSSGQVLNPTIHDRSTKEQIILDCAPSSITNVTYEWVDSEGRSLSTQQRYIVPRPKEDITLTCTVDNRLSKESQNITIPYRTERKGLSGCVIAWIVVGVIVGVVVLLYLCILGILSRFLGGCVNAFMASGILCGAGCCFCCRRNWKKGLNNLVHAVLPLIEKNIGGADDAEKGERMSPVDEKSEGRSRDGVEKE